MHSHRTALRALFLTIFCLTAFAAHAQTSIVRGRILSAVDSTAIAGATIMTVEGKINTMCDAQGYFTLKGVPRKTAFIEVHLLGFTTLKHAILLKLPTENIGNIYLKESENEIDAIVVKSDAPIAIQKGDTTQFNAAAFKTQPDADADDLMAKLPGVVIIDGKIEAQGEPIRKIYVDGRLFFGTDPMAALKNIPADAIESIQLFDEPSEMSRYSGFDDGQTQKAINIVTKTKSKKTTIVKAETSAGTDIDPPHRARYLFGGTFSQFSEKHRITLTGISNNINTMRFAPGDSDGGLDDNGNAMSQSGGLKKIYGGGMNYSYDSKKVRLSSSYTINYKDELTSKTSLLQYFANPPSFDSKSVSRRNHSTSQSTQQNANIRVEWTPNDKNIFVFSPRFNINSLDQYSQSYGMTMQDGDSLNRNLTLAPADNANLRLSGEAMWTRKFRKKGRSVTTSVSYNFDNRDGNRYQQDSLRDSYSMDDPDNPHWVKNDAFNRFYDQYSENNSAHVQFRYVEPFAKYHRVLFNAGWKTEWGNSDKQTLNRNEETLEYTEKDKRQSSTFNRDYTTMSAGLGYSFMQKKYQFNAAVDYQRLGQRRIEFEPNITDTKLLFSSYRPMVSFKYSLEKTKFLKAQYEGRSMVPGIDRMQNVIDDTSPSNVRIGNPDLDQGYEHRITVFYNSSNVPKSTNFSFMLNASTQSNFVTSETESMPRDRDTMIYVTEADRIAGINGYTPLRGAFLTKQINLNGYMSARTEATYSFTFKPIRSNVNITAGYSYIRTPSKYTILNYANIHSANIRVGVTSNVSESVDFNIYSNTSYNKTINSTKTNTTYLNEDIHYSMNVIFWKGFVFNSHVVWSYYSSTNTTSFSSSYYLLNLGIGKRLFKRRNGEIRITAYDLLNQNKSIQHFVRNNAIEDSQSNTLGRYVMARLSYRFNSMSRSNVPKNAKNVQNMGVHDIKRINSKENNRR